MTAITRTRWSRRGLTDSVATGVFMALAGLAAVPLVALLSALAVRGLSRVDFELFTALPPPAGVAGGGIGNAILGTGLVVLVAGAWSVPVGILIAVYLAEVAPTGWLAAAARAAVTFLAGLPSLLAGVFAYTAVVVLTGRFSIPAGGVALGLLMLPIIAVTAEAALRAVPAAAREAAAGAGATRAQVLWFVLLPAARPGILTGMLLAVSRAAGETAPLLFTMGFSDYWPTGRPLEPGASLAVLIFQFAKSPFPNQQAVGWSAALVLVLAVLSLTLAARRIGRDTTTAGGRP